MSRRISLLISLLLLCLTLSGCTGGQEIESCLFVIAMAVDAAPDGSLTITIKALSGTQESVSSSEQKNASGDASGGSEDGKNASNAAEDSEPGYIVLSATAPSCLRALGLLSATTPRTVNLSQLREIVLSQTIAETDATLSILREIHSIYRANGEAVVVVTPQNAGDFIRRSTPYSVCGFPNTSRCCLIISAPSASSRPRQTSPPSSPRWNPKPSTPRRSMPTETTLTARWFCRAHRTPTVCPVICLEPRRQATNTWAPRSFPVPE